MLYTAGWQGQGINIPVTKTSISSSDSSFRLSGDPDEELYVRSMVVNQGHISNKDCVKAGVILAASCDTTYIWFSSRFMHF